LPPTIHAILGPLKGTAIPLSEEDLTIGRDRANQLPITDLHLSRRHCVIKKDANDYKIVDLSSMNGVFVNAMPVRERILNHGDRLEIGASMFVYLTKQLDDSEESLLTDSASAMSSVTTKLDPTLSRIHDSKQLDTLLGINGAISCIQSVELIGRKLLELIFEVIPAQRGTILLNESQSDALIAICRINKFSPEEPVRVDRNIANQVMREKIGLLAQNLQSNDLNISSSLCVPFLFFNQVLGILYLDNLDSSVPLNEHHLLLAGAIAGIATSTIKNAVDIERLKEQSKRMQAELTMDRKIVGESRPMRNVLELINKISRADTTVLICGETGTGKELAARAIHANSRRSECPFVAINCAALPETLLESEVFGHEKGAFTGALTQKKGKLEMAEGGTVFLDEVAELAPAIQAKLLRFLQEREFERIGGTKTIKVDIRLLAATNKNLEKEISKGTFRQDLYYRLNVVQLQMPALREIEEDILLLAHYFISRLCQKLPRRVYGISQEAQQCLKEYDWPGNVRELENVLERAILLGSAEVILPEDLPENLLGVRQSFSEPKDFHEKLNDYKKKLIVNALKDCSFNYEEAATALGIHPGHLYRLVRTLGLSDEMKK
jgi:transcriptional regulator with PAS, ATPase and Fis domain